MPSSGSGIGTPVTTSPDITRAPQVRTHLALFRFARLMGVNPVHFAGATAENLWPNLGCDSVWPQYTWQINQEVVSRHYLSTEILEAEAEIKRVLGYAVAPEFEVQEEHAVSSINWNGALSTNWQKVISPGRRATSVIREDATVTYSDSDGDGFSETATVTAATTITDATEIRLFFSGYTDEVWEIRPLRSVSINNGVATIVADSWLFIDPADYELSPGQYETIDLSDTSPLVSAVDVVRVYVDTSVASVRLIWSKPGDYGICGICSGTGCAVCAETTQDGCFAILSDNYVKVYPATYSDGVWTHATPERVRPPDRVLLWYYAGDRIHNVLDPLRDRWARAIAFLAAARLALPVCDCTNVSNLFKELQVDLTLGKQGSFRTHSFSSDIFTNPFGTRAGEWRAWQQIQHMPETGRWGGTV